MLTALRVANTFFSHGIDSLNCTLASLCETAAMGIGPTKTGAFTALVPCLPMFFSTWETYHTHTLYLGYFNGPTEGLLLACTSILISGYYGPQIWSYPVADLLGHPEIFGTYSFRDAWIPILLLSFFIAHLPACIYHVVQARRRQNLPILPVFLEWTPMIVYTTSCCAWLASPYSSLLTHNRLVLFCLTMSFVFGRLTTKIILHHLTNQPFPYWTILLLPLVGGALLGNLPRLGFSPIDPAAELWYLRAYFVFALSAYMRWAYVVIDKICAYLDINCLTIKRRPGLESQHGQGIPSKQTASKSSSNGSLKKRA
jgi:ethanolaminephosphotransferase